MAWAGVNSLCVIMAILARERASCTASRRDRALFRRLFRGRGAAGGRALLRLPCRLGRFRGGQLAQRSRERLEAGEQRLARGRVDAGGEALLARVLK
ncbi:MAG: hypothetical protein ACK56I_11530, partial [bacterium]